MLGGQSACEAEMNITEYCEGGVVLHPCCVGLLGECIITTQDNCSFQQGHWHPDKVLFEKKKHALIYGTYRSIHGRLMHCESCHRGKYCDGLVIARWTSAFISKSLQLSSALY